MENTNYSQIYAKLIKGISPKVKDIFDRRFGVKASNNAKPAKNRIVNTETLESIGKGLGITRERVRQIEEAGFAFVRKNHRETLDKLFLDINAYFQQKGGFKKEEVLLEDLGKEKNKPYVLFLLALGSTFQKVSGKKDYHSFWVSNQVSGDKVKDTLYALVTDMKNHGKLLTREELLSKVSSKYGFNNELLASYLEISKKIQGSRDGKLGLIDWPEVKPRGVKDKAFLVFKEQNKPLHFRKITELIDTLPYNEDNKKTHPQTVHNELIKDGRFVLVGRGIYALREWGYAPGTIKEVITRLLKENQKGALQEEIVKEVLSQRFVAKNTVLINLNNKKYFQKDHIGRYFLKEVQSA